MNKITFIIILTILSCNQDKTIKAFGDSYSKLPLLNLPLTMQTSGDNFFTPPQKIITDTILKTLFGHGWGEPIGRLPDTENYFSVLSFLPSDAGTPIITTYTKTGKQIDSLYIFNDRPAITIGLISKQFATITADRLIQFTDSTSYIDTLDNILSSEVIKKTFYLDNSGHIKQR